MTHRVFVTGSGLHDSGLAVLADARCSIKQGDPADSVADLRQKISEFKPHALIVRQGKITSDVIGISRNLKIICKHGAGTDNIDIDAATNFGIPVFYTPGATSDSVAEHTLALMLALTRQIADQDRRVRQGDFNKSNFSGQELAGKTLGLVGFGRIARRVSELVVPFRMRVIAFHPSCTAEKLPEHIVKTRTAKQVFSAADFVSLHLPLTLETRGMVNRRMLCNMKNTAYLINTSRGPIVNEGDLIEALKANQLRGAALDTFEVEPPPDDCKLFKMRNVVLTMHIAGNSDESLRNMAVASATHVLAFLNDRDVDFSAVVNPGVLTQ